ncbi:MAG: hypothetical protein ACRDL7_07075 [Gaiellaceae bacterium]
MDHVALVAVQAAAALATHRRSSLSVQGRDIVFLMFLRAMLLGGKKGQLVVIITHTRTLILHWETIAG